MHSLGHLNQRDRFNIFIFKDKTISFSPVSLTVEKQNIKKALRFLEGLDAGSTTNVYDALQVSVNLKDAFTPSYRMLLSDGFPTRGITDARQVINDIAAINKGKVSIFAFGGGSSVSEYMLDFIAYKNRGWSQVAQRDYLIAQEFSKLYDKIRDPLLLNLRYHVSGLNEREIFPQVLPDFFKGSDFIIYGKYTNEDKFIMQVIGDVSGSKKSFMVTAALDEALIADKEIARQWAFHKVYHLIGELKYNANNEKLIKSIDELCTRFDIITPYSKNFRVK
jgi:Ca-activated chloride channel family protein